MKIRQSRKMRDKTLRKNSKVNLPADYGWRVLGALAKDLAHLLNDSDKKQLNAVVRNRDFDAYLQLSEAWGPQSSTLTDISIAEMRAKYQVCSLIKKFRFPSDNAARRSAAIDKFVAAERVCAAYNRHDYKPLALVEDDRMCNVFTHARVFLNKVLGHCVPDVTEMTLWSRHGPGANLDTKDGRTSQYFKYNDWPYSCTKDATREARLAIQSDPRWLGALEDDYRSRNNIPRNIIVNQDHFWSSVIQTVPGNRIAFVPKSALIDRSIAIEPSLNLYLQLGVDGFIRRRLKRWGIDLDSQEKNRELARRGSLNWDSPENFATLDLAAASDSISIRVCHLLLPRLWYNHLMMLRSPVGELDGETISYEKISSMGNGFTFALESAIFASIVYGCMCEFEGCYDKDRCAIYGDDLIVPSGIVEPVVTALNLAGFSINSEKSFSKGPFRESCGADWFKGKAVRPVFLTTLPSSAMELFTDLNRLRRILSLRFMEEESFTESLLETWIPDKLKGIVGPCSDEAFDSYRHVSVPPIGTYQDYLYKYETLVVRPKPVAGTNFLFRKLMHDLRGQPLFTPLYKTHHGTWKGCKLTTSGSRFTITKANKVIVGYSYSITSNWCPEYAEPLPDWKPWAERD